MERQEGDRSEMRESTRSEGTDGDDDEEEEEAGEQGTMNSNMASDVPPVPTSNPMLEQGDRSDMAGGVRGSTTVAVVSSAATTDQVSAKMAAAGYPTMASLPATAAAPSSGTASTLPNTISTATAPLVIMDEKAMYRDDIEPMPQPAQTPVSRPGAFPCHRGRCSSAREPPATAIGSGGEDNLISGESNNPQENGEQDTTTSTSSVAVQANHSTANASTNTDPSSPQDVSARHLPIAAELAEDEETRLKEIEAQLRQEFEQRMQAEYVRKSKVEALMDDNMDASGDLIVPGGGSSRAIVVAEAAPVKGSHNGSEAFMAKKKVLFLVLLLLIGAIVIGIILGAVFANQSGDGDHHEDEGGPMKDILPNVTTIVVETVATVAQRLKPVLQTIRERGILRCQAEALEAQKGVGFTIDLCKAIAAAIFDNASQVEHPEISFKEQFAAVARGELDVTAAHVSLNMGRDVREVHSGVGHSFSTPYLYTGTGLAGVPNFVQCAEQAETFEQECRHLQVCVVINTVTQDIVEAHLPGTATKLVQGHLDLFTQFANGNCNVIAGDTVMLIEQFAREAGYEGDYVFSNQLLSHEHLALLTRQSDPEFADFVDWILRALITAEALNITQETAHTFGTTNVFGPKYKNMFVQAIAAVGNYGEMYARHYEATMPRTRYNSINMGDTGLIVSDPLGLLTVDEETMAEEELPRPIPNGTIEAVINRGYLLCGIMLKDPEGNPRTGFAEYNSTTDEWSGIDVDYCRGLAAAVSSGKTRDIVFVNLSDPETRYRSLANMTVDVVAGDNFNILTDVKEPTTGKGFTFSTPYFYYNATTALDGGALALLTRPDDRQWSDLANWVVQATFHAEENYITLASASEMPIVELWGVRYKQMLRDVILSIGNYGEIYARNLEATMPRGGRNLLNDEDTPQFYPIIPFEPTR